MHLRGPKSYLCDLLATSLHTVPFAGFVRVDLAKVLSQLSKVFHDNINTVLLQREVERGTKSCIVALRVAEYAATSKNHVFTQQQ